MRGISVRTSSSVDRASVLYGYRGQIVRNYVNPLPTSNLVNNLVPLRRVKGDHYYKNPLSVPIVQPILPSQTSTLNHNVESPATPGYATPAATTPPATPTTTDASMGPASTEPNGQSHAGSNGGQQQDQPAPVQTAEGQTQTDPVPPEMYDQSTGTTEEKWTQLDSQEFGGKTSIDVAAGPIPPPSDTQMVLRTPPMPEPPNPNETPGVVWVTQPGVPPAGPPSIVVDPVKFLTRPIRVRVPVDYRKGFLGQTPLNRQRRLRGGDYDFNRRRNIDFGGTFLGGEPDDDMYLGGGMGGGTMMVGGTVQIHDMPTEEPPTDEVGEPTGTALVVEVDDNVSDAASNISRGTAVGKGRKVNSGDTAPERMKREGRDKEGKALHGRKSESERKVPKQRAINKPKTVFSAASKGKGRAKPREPLEPLPDREGGGRKRKADS